MTLEDVEAVIRKVDVDGDGQINYEEFTKVLAPHPHRPSRVAPDASCSRDTPDPAPSGGMMAARGPLAEPPLPAATAEAPPPPPFLTSLSTSSLRRPQVIIEERSTRYGEKALTETGASKAK